MHSFLKGYKLEFKSKAKRALRKIDKKNSSQIIKQLNLLVSGHDNLDIKKLSAKKSPLYRLRCGNYRAIYKVEHKVILVIVVKIGHRKNIYDEEL